MHPQAKAAPAPCSAPESEGQRWACRWQWERRPSPHPHEQPQRKAPDHISAVLGNLGERVASCPLPQMPPGEVPSCL